MLLWGYALDASLTVLDTIVGIWWESPFTWTRNLIASGVMTMAGIWLVMLLVVGDRLRRWALFWLAVSTMWLNWGGQPIGLFFDDRGYEAYARALGLVQLAIGAATLLNVRRSYGAWILNERLLSDQPWRIARWIGQMLLKAPVLGVLFAAYQPLYVLTILEQASGAYVHFTWRGMNVRDVEFVHETDGSVRLVGMAHVGEPLSYQRILESFELPDTVILEEGLTDKTGLLTPSVSPSPRWDRRRPITVQPPMTAVNGARHIDRVEARNQWVNVLRADVDTAQLSPETLAWARDYAEMLSRARSARGIPLELLLEEFTSPMSDSIWNEILYSRNDHLLDSLKQVRGTFRHIIVPWGALHMPGITQGLLALGYRPSANQSRHEVLRWTTVFRTLRGRAGRATRTLSADELNDIAGRATEAIYLTRQPALKLLPADAAAGARSIARLGGLPTRYEGEEWPVNPETGVPLGFVAELARSEAAAPFFGRVRSVRLFVDYTSYDGTNDPAAYRVWIDRTDDPARGQRGWTQPELAALADAFGAADKDGVGAITWSVTELRAAPVTSLDRQLMPFVPFGLARDQYPLWWDAEMAAMDAFSADHPDLELDGYGSFIGGHPQWIQEADTQRLPFFLQLSPEGEMGWGDGGTFYLFLDRDDPDEVALVGQSS